jgi:hypothetical protein
VGRSSAPEQGWWPLTSCSSSSSVRVTSRLAPRSTCFAVPSAGTGTDRL